MKVETDIGQTSAAVAVVDIGATFLRLIIAEKRGEREYHILDRAVQSAPIGRDVVVNKRVTNATIEQCAEILKRFRLLLAEYNIQPNSVKAFASAAVRQASNIEAFLDRLSIASRITFLMLEPGQAGYYYHLAFRAIKYRQATWERGGAVVMEIGGLTCGLLYRKDNEIRFAQTYGVGTLRIREQMEAAGLTQKQLEEVVDGRTREMAIHLRQNIGNEKIKLLFMGREMRFAAAHLRSEPVTDASSATGITRLSVAELRNLISKIIAKPLEAIVRSWQISYPDAELLTPTLYIALSVAEALKLKNVYVSNLSFSDGLMVEALDGPAWTTTMMRHVVRIARETGEKYLYDASHSEQVTNLALALFDLLRPEHDCTERHRLLLEVASILHDIGVFVNARGHHKHTMYLIRNTEFTGLSAAEINLIALVARYHRKAVPQMSHPEYAALRHEDRLVVGKLAALLRVADALDRVHDQSLGHLRFELDDDALNCIPERRVGVSAEQIALGEKGDLFETIYGKRCFLRSPH